MPSSILLIDNYDSFTYNLFQALRILGADVQLYRNDRISIEQALELSFDTLIISPGPGTPKDAGISIKLIQTFLSSKKILGVCLGHQAIAQALGGDVVHAPKMLHGKADWIRHHGEGIFKGLPSPFCVGRYHSLMVSSLPPSLKVTSYSDDGVIMSIEHRKLPVFGLQFHPESILSPMGMNLLHNFLRWSAP